MRHYALTSVALLLFTLSGCGDKTSDKGDDKGGGGNASSKIVGKWELDMEATKEQIKKQAGDNPLAGFAEGMLDSMKIELDCKSDGSANFSIGALGQTQTASGKWTTSGDGVTIEATDDKGETQTMKGTFIGSDKLKLVPEGEEAAADQEMHLKRVS